MINTQNIKKGLLLIAVCSIFYPLISANNVYFVDGYHGGIYGHYPVAWKTGFITDHFKRYPEWRICMEIEPETWDSVKLKTPVDYRAEDFVN